MNGYSNTYCTSVESRVAASSCREAIDAEPLYSADIVSAARQLGPYLVRGGGLLTFIVICFTLITVWKAALL